MLRTFLAALFVAVLAGSALTQEKFELKGQLPPGKYLLVLEAQTERSAGGGQGLKSTLRVEMDVQANPPDKAGQEIVVSVHRIKEDSRPESGEAETFDSEADDSPDPTGAKACIGKKLAFTFDKAGKLVKTSGIEDLMAVLQKTPGNAELGADRVKKKAELLAGDLQGFLERTVFSLAGRSIIKGDAWNGEWPGNSSVARERGGRTEASFAARDVEQNGGVKSVVIDYTAKGKSETKPVEGTNVVLKTKSDERGTIYVDSPAGYVSRIDFTTVIESTFEGSSGGNADGFRTEVKGRITLKPLNEVATRSNTSKAATVPTAKPTTLPS